MSVIEIIMENIEGLSIDEIRSMMKYYENIEAYEVCASINAHITAIERDKKLEELGIID
jgi:hypothetical protein